MKFDILQATFKVKAVSNVEMPVVGLGTWKLDAPALKPVLERAVELGCRHIDCAMIYENEGAIGGVLKSIFDNKGRFKVDRKDVSFPNRC
jgi:diketogulonate reductase-like aldo/keto reductase